MKRIISLSLLLLCVQLLFSHPWKPSHYIIIDTDGGMDDLKAINMLLASPDVRVMAITASGGVMTAEDAYLRIRSLLNKYHHQGMLTGINRGSAYKEMSVPADYKWASQQDLDAADAPDANELISYVLENESTPVSFISLSSLNTVYEYSSYNPLLFKKIKDIIWSNDSAAPLRGFNYELDTAAAHAVIRKDIPIKIVGYEFRPIYSKGLLDQIAGINNPYASSTTELFRKAAEHDFIYGLVDDMIPVFLHYPMLFENDSINNDFSFFSLTEDRIDDKVIYDILSGNTVNRNQVFKEIPSDTSFYFPDLQEYIGNIIANNGKEEWEAGVLANELHRHLGVYAIIGVKMGIRAREYFHIGVDELYIKSSAGSVPPISCMNDGLQVSTGATTGHGLIEVTDTLASPSASFTYMDRTISLSLTKDIASEIKNELKEINYIYGLDSNIYWELVRQKAILYWKNLDRHEIFDLTICH
ncbi:MAG: nucleoside hydrolase [Bacteroidales bacterium]|nr:nucleoside hydrolase [Bacteroidales bacterium]